MKVTKEQIAEWKKKFGDIYQYNTDDGQYGCYLRKPSRLTLSRAGSVASTDPLKYSEVIISDCWLGGDEQIKSDDSYFLGLSKMLGELVEIKEGTLKKL